MRLIILNPHANQCGKMIYNWLFRFPQHNKYTYLWEVPATGSNQNIAFLVDGKQSSFYQTPYFTKTIARFSVLLRFFVKIEFWFWRMLNGSVCQKCATIFKLSELDPHNDIIMMFGFTDHKSDLREYPGAVLIHLSHYHINTEKIAALFSTLKNGFFVSEGEVAQNDYFQHFFPYGANRTYLLPFTYYPGRFINNVKFEDRVNKCFASGPMSVPNDSSYTKHYGPNIALNPMREILYKHKTEITESIAAYIFPHNFAITGMREIYKSDAPFTRFAKRYLPAWFLTAVLKIKLPYYNFNIVEKYNEYTMFSSPEERTGLPSMKLLEGILCGAVLVGIDDPMYTSIGFKDGVNYVAYKNNDLANLVKQINYYQANPEKLKAISEAGQSFISSKFTPEKVFGIFWRDLEKLLVSINTGKPQFQSSFVE